MTNVTVKFKMAQPVQMELVEVYPYKVDRPQFDFDEDSVVMNTTIDKLSGMELKELAHKATKLYLRFLRQTVKFNWMKASLQQRQSACKAYRWLRTNFIGGQVVATIKARNYSLFDEYIILRSIVLYTD